MKEYHSTTIADFLLGIRNLFTIYQKAFLTLLSWDDGDYFIDICLENGGIAIEQQQIFEHMPLGQKYTSLCDLELFLNRLAKISFFHSLNKKCKLYFDIHIWIGEYYYIFNPFLNEVYFEKLNCLGKLFHPMIIPKWQQKKSNLVR